MRRLTIEEAQALCHERGFVVSEHRVFSRSAQSFTVDLTLSKLARALAVTARMMTEQVKDSDTVMVVEEWAIWPTEEFSILLPALFASCNDTRPLINAPGFVCSTEEEIRDLTRLSLLSGWGGYLFSTAASPTFHFDHDEWISISHPSENLVTEWAAKYLKCLPDTKQLWSGVS